MLVKAECIGKKIGLNGSISVMNSLGETVIGQSTPVPVLEI